MMLRLRFAAALLLFAPLLSAETPAKPENAPAVLTLEDCVARALGNNFDIIIQRFTSESARYDVDIAKADYDPLLSASSTKTFSKSPPDTTTVQTIDSEGNVVTTAASFSQEQDVEESTLSVSKKIASGATVTASGLLDRNKNTPATRSGLNPAYLGDVALFVRQPLLRGAGTGVNRAAIERARIGIDRSRFDLKAAVLAVVRDVEAAYYNLVFAREQLLVRQFSLQIAQELLEENTARRNTGVATDLEVLQSEVGVANARRDLVLAEQASRNSEDALLNLIGEHDFNQVPPTVRFGEEPQPEVSFDRSYQLARENQPDYRSAELFLSQLELDVKTAKNNRLPQLDLGGGVGYSSREGSYSRAATEVWDGDGYNWQVDLSVTLPWGFRAENARHRQALLSLNREQARLQQIEQNILVAVRSAIRAVETNRETVRLSALATELSEKQFQQEKARYEAGLSTFRFVQQSQADLDAARVNELQARVNLRVALADLARLEGSSLQRYKIALSEPKP